LSAHWRLALRYAAWVSGAATVLAAGIWLLSGPSYAWAFGYGVGVGLICFVSTAMTVSLITGGSTAAGVTVGAASFLARMGFAAGALGVPAYLGLWPVVVMLAGFAGVYVAENVALVLGTPKFEGFVSVVGREEEGPVDEGAERRVEV
jgi:hypothetical protein